MMSTTLTRVITAIFMMGVIAFVYALYPPGINVLIVAVGMVAIHEGVRMQYPPFWSICAELLFVLMLVADLNLHILMGLVLVLYLLRVGLMFGSYHLPWVGHFLCVSQFIDIVLLTQTMLLLFREQPLILLYTIITLSGIDSFAYFAGKRYGTHRVVPKISPNKTLEGYLAAAIWVVFVGSMVMIVKDIRILILTLCIVMVYLLAITGDLLVSYQKRILSVKDTGAFLPGHGGFLDRIDSWMYVVPFICWVLNSN